MLNSVELKNLYFKIQNQIFYMIPEKWDKIFLYAAILEDKEHLLKGEMFFYYYPSGLLKKNPVNVYEIPAKFNIDEKSYTKLVNSLYETIKYIRKEFEKAEEEMWTSLTISIENLKFKVEYDYEDLRYYTNEERHIIWQYKYLDLSLDRLTKKQKEMLKQYLIKEQFQNKKTKEHEEDMYQMHVHNIVEYNREEKPILLGSAKQIKKEDEAELDIQEPEGAKNQIIEIAKKENENKSEKESEAESMAKNQILLQTFTTLKFPR